MKRFSFVPRKRPDILCGTLQLDAFGDWVRYEDADARIAELEAEIVERRKDYSACIRDQDARIAELEEQLTAAQERNTAEKKRRVYYQHIVYSVCNMLDQIDGRHHCIVCGTAEEPCNNVEAKIQQLTTELDSLRQQLAAAQERNVVLQSEHLDHVSALHKRIKELEKKNDHK